MSIRPDHERFQHMLGAYVLGGLDAADRAEMDGHVSQCTACRRELTAYAVVPGLLSRITAPAPARPSDQPQTQAPEQTQSQGQAQSQPHGQAHERAHGLAPVDPSDTPTPALRGAIRARRRSRRRLAVAGIAGLAACTLAAGVGIGSMLLAPSGNGEGPGPGVRPAPVSRTVTLAGDAGVMGGTADLASKPWGTELRLKLHDLPAGERLQVIAIGKDGRSEAAGTWTTPKAGKIKLMGATSMRPNGVRRIDIRADKGKVLATSKG